jgi:hypothetical protein
MNMSRLAKFYNSLQETAKQHDIMIKKLQGDIHDEHLTRQSMVRVHSDENQVPKSFIAAPLRKALNLIFMAGTKNEN